MSSFKRCCAIVAVVLISGVLVSATAKSSRRLLQTKPCACPMDIYAPVCGVDGNTYPNTCELECAGVIKAYNGQCAKPSVTTPACTCPMVFFPVCGANGQTYTNYCFAECAGQTTWTTGQCAQDCVCPMVFDPVCGNNNKTYGNKCEALCQGTYVKHDGPCETVSADSIHPCPVIYQPVCGSDGQTYESACVAEQSGVSNWTNGPCIIHTQPEKPPCGCPPVLAPVCGQNNVTYTNKCFAECGFQTTVAYNGPCTDQCATERAACLLEPVPLPPNEIPAHKPCCAGTKCLALTAPEPGQLWGVCKPIIVPN